MTSPLSQPWREEGTQAGIPELAGLAKVMKLQPGLDHLGAGRRVRTASTGRGHPVTSPISPGFRPSESTSTVLHVGPASALWMSVAVVGPGG